MKLPSNPRAVVTGAASGFGQALALRLASRRARLVLADIDDAGLEATATQAREAGSEVHVLHCDVREAEQIEALAVCADAEYGGTDLLVNNAGVAVAGPVGDVPLADWRWQLEINLFGVIYGCHAFVPRMKAQGSGHILNVSSAAGLVCGPKMGPYSVSKAGVIALSETLYGELKDDGIGVSVLCPTFFRTNIHQGSRFSDDDLLKLTTKLVTKADWSAEQIVDYTFEAIERGELIVIPQPDGRAMWRAKRLFGAGFHGWMNRLTQSPRLMRLLTRGR
ncbi:MAG: SDR family NAD(P)-dependent oxidoreductase [Myxococcota bacterium]